VIPSRTAERIIQYRATSTTIHGNPRDDEEKEFRPLNMASAN